MIKGLDVSAYQSNVDWKKLKDNGFDFVYIKHSQGVGSIDRQFVTHFRDAKAAGLKVGIYHFATLNNKDEVTDAKAEAEFFKAQTSHLVQDLWPVVDVETNDIGLTKEEVELWISTYCQTLGGKCMLYSGAWFLNANLNPNHKLGNIPLWMSGYPFDKKRRHVPFSMIDDAPLPKPPIGWKNWSVWQWTGYGVVPGINGDADLNVANSLSLL